MLAKYAHNTPITCYFSIKKKLKLKFIFLFFFLKKISIWEGGGCQQSLISRLSHKQTTKPPNHRNHEHTHKHNHNQPMEHSPKRTSKARPIHPSSDSLPPNAPLWRFTQCLLLSFRSQILHRTPGIELDILI
jgi:hypothetical protein